MKSSVLSFFHIDIDAFIIVITILLITVCISLFFLIYDYRRMRRNYVEFMQGESGKNLEYTIYKRFREIDQLREGQKDNDNQVSIIYNKLRQNYSKTGIYKYNAFNRNNESEESEKNSFALTMLNEENTGFILNVIHSRAGCHIYMKEIMKGKAISVLSDEEKASLSLALE